MGRIIRFIRKNIILTILLALSIFCIIKFSELPIILGTPKFIADIFLKPAVNTTYYEIFRLLENLSLAYIASLMFYIIVDYIPKEKMADQSIEIIQSKLTSLYLYMSEIIATFNIALDIKKDVNNIESSDVQPLDTITIKDELVYFKTYPVIDGEKRGFQRDYFNYRKDAPKYVRLIKETIISIKEMPCSTHLDFDILQTLSAIETNHFLVQVLFFEEEFESENIHRVNFGNNYYEFLQSYKNLNKFKFQKISYHKEIMSDDEEKEYIKIRKSLRRRLSKKYKAYLGKNQIS